MACCVAWYVSAGWLPSSCFLMLTLGTNRRNADSEGGYFSSFSGNSMEIRWARSQSLLRLSVWLGVGPQFAGRGNGGKDVQPGTDITWFRACLWRPGQEVWQNMTDVVNSPTPCSTCPTFCQQQAPILVAKGNRNMNFSLDFATSSSAELFCEYLFY